MFNIQSATEQDIPTIVEIHKKCIKGTNSKVYSNSVIDSWLDLINEESVLAQFENTTWIVIKEDNNTIGFAQYDLEDMDLYQIQVDPDYQRREYGRELYKYIEDDFIKSDKDKISLNATLNAVPFYRNLGFRRVENITYDGIDMVSMEKQLK